MHHVEAKRMITLKANGYNKQKQRQLVLDINISDLFLKGNLGIFSPQSIYLDNFSLNFLHKKEVYFHVFLANRKSYN